MVAGRLNKVDLKNFNGVVFYCASMSILIKKQMLKKFKFILSPYMTDGLEVKKIKRETILQEGKKIIRNFFTTSQVIGFFS